MFMKGLAQTSTGCMASSESGGGGQAFGALIFILVVVIYGALLFDLVRFRRRMNKGDVKWNGSKKVNPCPRRTQSTERVECAS